ncbi:MAG: guanine deaminase [Pseudomonadota bacterium]
MKKLILGQILNLAEDPFLHGISDAGYRRDGAILVEEGVFRAFGSRAELLRAHPDCEVEDFGDALLLPSFVDCHAHYPQTRIIASWGKRLIDWLNGYTFPEEMKFSDAAYARAVAEEYLSHSVANGITSASVYCTIHPESVDALMQAALERGMAIAAGKVMMDRETAPDGLRDAAQASYDDSKALLERWHGQGRLRYAVTPRFAPTSTEAQLAVAGALWAEHPGTTMQTHLSEQPEEIAWVKSLYPNDADYLAIYERFGLTGQGAIMGHCIHLTEREKAAMVADGTSVAHCPTSNTFIGSGLCDVRGLKEAGIPVGLATDVGGGSSFSMLRTMAAAYEISQLRGQPLHPAELLWLATKGSAQCMNAADAIGAFTLGNQADFVALNLASTPVIANRAARANDIWEAVFPTIMMGDDRAITATWIAGQRQ